MSFFNDVSIGGKLRIGFFIPIVMTIALGVLSIVLVEKLSDNAHTIATVHLASIRAVADINVNVSDYRIAELQHIISSDKKEQEIDEVAMRSELESINTGLRAYESMVSEKERPAFSAFKKEWDLYLAESPKIIELSRQDKDEEAKVLTRGRSQTHFDEASKRLLELVKLNNEKAEAAVVHSNELHSFSLYSTLIVLALTVAISFWLAQTITPAIADPVRTLTEAAKKIAAGNLRQDEMRVLSRDEIGELTGAFNNMLVSIKDMTGQTRVATQNLNSATAEILASTQEQAASTTEQAAAVQQTTATVEEINQSGNQISERAKQVAAAAEAASTTSNAGAQAVVNTSRTMESIREQAEAVAENIVALSEKTQAVGEIIATVNDIAEQSNLLALNAAIEAAAAGDHGRRFSVVANELKNLADQSKASTVQVRTILGEIQKGINTSVMLTEEAVKRVETGKQQAEVAERTIRQMTESTVSSVQAFQQIVAATNQQSIGFDQVTQALKNIRVASQQNAAGTQQMEKAAANLNALGQQLSKSVERYQL
jgi:methyl-accepting chemotaxis protein